MKVVCVLADVPVMQQMADTMKEAAELLGDVEIVFGDWLDGKETDFSNEVLKIERGGPNGLVIPKILQDHLDADVLIGAFCPFSRALMDQMPNLKAICIARGGIENVDLEAATEKGVVVVNAAGRNANAVSDFAVGMILCEVRNIAKSHFNIKSGNPEAKLPNENRIPDIEGKTVGLIGFGHIGRLVAKKLRGFDVNIAAYDPFLTEEDVKDLPVTLMEKDEIFQKADIISVHARLSENTKHMIGRHEIGLMKDSAYLVNTARAGLIDYDALYEALKNHRIAGAALDVFYKEPVLPDSPWLKLDNVTLTGHMGGATADAQKKSPLIAVNKLIDYIENGNTTGIVNLEAIK